MSDDGMVEVRSPLQGVIARVERTVGDRVEQGSAVVVVESMKMEHPIPVGVTGTVHELRVGVDDQVNAGQIIALVTPGDHDASGSDPARDSGQGQIPTETAPGALQFGTQVVSAATQNDERGDLREVVERHAVGLDRRRPEAVERRHGRAQRTARENLAHLCDAGSFVEYGALAVAAQRRRRSLEELVERTPADGLVAGVGAVDGQPTAVLTYDYTVLAGTQGFQNHRKKDRLFEVIERQRLPVVFFTEGGGGRPGDVDAPGVSGLDCLAFQLWGQLSGQVPMVGIASGRCFAGNAALLGCCDVIIATEGANIGMGGPAMIEGGGLGVFAPEEIGPLDVQVANGVVDIAVADEAEAVEVAKQYLSYFAPPVGSPKASPPEGTSMWTCADQAALRDLVPENRRLAYDVRAVVETLADEDSVLELRRGFGKGMITALARIEGRPLGILANNPAHLGGAIDADGADKAARFMQLCEAFGLPLLLLCDTPGIMVGPEAEATGLVRHVNRLFVTGANLTVPLGTIILRKAYGLGAQTMAGGSFKAPLFCVAWPTGELGGMGLEGAVRLGFRRELEAIEDPAERDAAFERMVAQAYQHGKALNAASHFEIDDVIDPVDSRRWITTAFNAALPVDWRASVRRPFVDTW